MFKRYSILAILLYAMCFAPSAYADIQFDSIGILAGESTNNVSGTHQHSVSFRYRLNSQSTRFWLPDSLDFTVGAIESGSDTGTFVSFGPSYRFNISKREIHRWFVDFGIHPTYISNSTLQGRALGGNYYFTSYLGMGAFLGQQSNTSIQLRIQHSSNAGLNFPNPGLDMMGLSVSYHFGGHQQPLSAGAAEQK
jgi:hypothetical protein